MIRENQTLINKINILLDWFLIFAAFLLGFELRFLLFEGRVTVPLKSYIILALAVTPMQLIAYKFIGVYDSGRKKKTKHVLWSIIFCNFAFFALIMMALYISKDIDFSRGALFIFFALENIFILLKHILVRKVLRHLRGKGYNQKFIIFVGNGTMVQTCLDELRSSPELGYTVIGYVADADGDIDAPRLGGLGRLEDILVNYKPDEVIAALNAEEYYALQHIIGTCEATGTRLYIVPYYAQWLPMRPYIDSLNGIPLLGIRRVALDNVVNAFLKRTADIVCSLLLIILTSPIMLVAAVGVKLSSPGPIIFKQERVGREKKTFYMYKFRSMRVNSEENTGWSRNRDSRKTRFGSFIRKYSIDELPQLFNVLKGDMSLVGPRPEIPHYVEQFRREIPLYMVKHQVRPGMTGWAQVHGLRGDTSIEKRIEYDIYYIEHWSLALDLRILFMTVRHVRNEEVLV